MSERAYPACVREHYESEIFGEAVIRSLEAIVDAGLAVVLAEEEQL